MGNFLVMIYGSFGQALRGFAFGCVVVFNLVPGMGSVKGSLAMETRNESFGMPATSLFTTALCPALGVGFKLPFLRPDGLAWR